MQDKKFQLSYATLKLYFGFFQCFAKNIIEYIDVDPGGSTADLESEKGLMLSNKQVNTVFYFMRFKKAF